MSNTIPEMKEVKNLITALASINESIIKLERSRQLLINTSKALSGENDEDSELDNVIETIRSEIADAVSRIPSGLPEEDAIEWLKVALLDIIENNT